MIFRQYLKLIIFFLVIVFSHKTIASTENETYEIRKSCLKAGGSWRQFNNSCANNCSENKFNVCSQILIFACDCGIDSCWNQSKCIKNTEYNQLLTAEPKKEPNELEKKEIEKNNQDGVHTRKKIMFKVIDQSLARAQSIKDIAPKKSIKKNSQTTDKATPSENNTNNNNSTNNSANIDSALNIFDDSKNNKPTINAGNNLKDIYKKIGIIDDKITEPTNKKEESSITDSVSSIFNDRETPKQESKQESKNDENKTAENSSKQETKKSSGLLSFFSIDEDKDKDKNKLEIPLPPLFNEEKKNPENKNNESNVIKKSDDKTSKTSGVK